LNLAEAKRDYTPESIAACNDRFIESIRAACLSTEDFEREYRCQPAKLSQLISSEEYDACAYRDVPDNLHWLGERCRDLYVGIDCGRKHDLTVVWVIEASIDPHAPEHLADVYRTVAVLALRRVGFKEQEELIRKIVDHPAIVKGYIDQGVIGMPMAESLYGDFGIKVEPFTITGPRKGALCERVRQYVQQMRVGLPTDPKIKQDILSMRRVATDKGTMTYEGGTRETHADYFIALGLALEAAMYGTRVQLALPHEGSRNAIEAGDDGSGGR
jgi:phage FluMu gp28-like protein